MKNTVRKFVCTLLIVACFMFINVSATSEVHIPDDAVKYNGHYYKLYSGNWNWSEANALCTNAGGHLATITSVDEQQIIENLMAKDGYGHSYWLGATNLSGTFQWITNEPWSFSYWSSNQPDRANSDQSYLRIYGRTDLFGGWDDFENSSICMNGAICEWDFSRKTIYGKLNATTLAVEINGDEMWISEITIDGDKYAVKKGALPLSIDEHKGKDIVAIVENDEVVSCTPEDEITADLSISVSPYNTNISYKKKQYSDDKVNLNVVLTNILSSTFTGNKSDLENVAALQKVISTVKLTSSNPDLVNFNGNAECKLTDLQMATLDVSESCSGLCTADINTKYKISDMRKSEIVNVKCEVTYAERAELHTVERSISIVFDNYNYEPDTPEETKEETNTNNQDDIKITKDYKENVEKVAKELKGANALSLSYDLVNNGILTEEQLHLLEKDLLCRMAMSTVPPKDFDTWLSEKVMREIFPQSSILGFDKYDITQTFYVDSPEYGPIEITFATTVSKYSFEDYGFASTGDISYEIKGDVPKDYKEGFAGGGVTADVTDLCEAMSEAMQSAIKSAYDKAWGDDANKVAEMIFSKNVQNIISYSQYGTFSNMVYESMCYPTKKFVGKCPIDINVYDEDGNLCTSIKNNEVVLNCEKANAIIDGDTKIIWLSDENFKIEIIALGDSKMDITIEEYANSTGLIRTININDIDIKYGSTYSNDISQDLLCDVNSYNITASTDEIFEVDENINHLHSHILGEWTELSNPTCTSYGKKITECLTCERTVVSFTQPIEHSYSVVIVTPTCTENGITTYTCTCGDSYTETIEATGHDFDGSRCKNCEYDKAADCGCNCHKKGIANFFFKLILFFQKLFKSNQICKCGAYHY